VVRRLRKVSEPGAVGEVIEVMELGAYAEQRARTLSLGNTQQHGTTVLLSSHRLAEVARVADRIGVLHHGRLVQELDADGLDRANRLHSHLEVAARDDTRAAQALHTAGLACRQGPHGLAIRDPWAVAHPDEVATTLVRAGIPPMHIGLVQEDLEAYFLRLVAQIVAVGGLLVFGMVSIWLFGREFSDGTLKDLLALPTSRSAVVLAKLIVGAGWCLALAAYVTVLSLAAGYLLGLPGWSAATAARGLGTIGLVAVLTIALTTAYGLVASIGRGYLPAVGAMFATLFAAQVTAAVGYGEWFPWSVPSLLSGVAGEGQAAAGSLSLALVLIVGAAGALGTAVWWERADHDR
jgi:ABC-2 type transport system permease protein